MGLRDARDLGHCGWTGALSAVRQAIRGTVHATTHATPAQLVFNCNVLLNMSFEAD